MELGLEYAPADSKLAVETVRNPATKAVTPKTAVAIVESTMDSTGAESKESKSVKPTTKLYGEK